MKNVQVSFSKTTDTTGYLFSLAKCLSAALRYGGYEEFADDIIATSGFAFRLWSEPNLNLDGIYDWDLSAQTKWVENGGITCGYIERPASEAKRELKKRLEATELIRESVNRGIAAVVWEFGENDWGLATGYDDEMNVFSTLSVSGLLSTKEYEELGNDDSKILSVLTVTGKKPKPAKQLIKDTKALAVNHLAGNEPFGCASGLAAYDTIIRFIRGTEIYFYSERTECTLGTFAALRYYAARFFEKYGEKTLAELYREIHEAWQKAFEICEASGDEAKPLILKLLRKAKKLETEAYEIMSEQ